MLYHKICEVAGNLVSISGISLIIFVSSYVFLRKQFFKFFFLDFLVHLQVVIVTHFCIASGAKFFFASVVKCPKEQNHCISYVFHNLKRF